MAAIRLWRRGYGQAVFCRQGAIDALDSVRLRFSALGRRLANRLAKQGGSVTTIR